jgi:predicted RNase H-like nuclease (RuvC/YqgF family)
MSKSSIYGESYKPISKEQEMSKELTRRELKEQSTRNQRIRQLGHLLKESRTEVETLKRRLREAEARVVKQQATEAELARLRRTLGRR